MDSNAAISLYKTIKDIARQPQRDNCIIGTVKTVNPLKIDIGNNVILDENFLWLGQMCRPHRVTIPHTHIIDTHFTQPSKAIGNHVAGTMPPTISAQEQQLDTQAKSTMISYTTLKDETNDEVDGIEEPQQISEADLGRGAIQKQLTITGQATVAQDQLTFTDNGHKHIIDRQITKDVHFAKSDFQSGVTLCIEPSLSIGDRVLMFAFNNWQMYYVAERIEHTE